LVLDGIMQERRNHQVWTLSLGGLSNQHGNFEKVVHIGLLTLALAALMRMPMSDCVSRL
jgi:hypothetical protein